MPQGVVNVAEAGATKNPENGDLILMHPKKHTLSVLGEVVKFYQNQGFKLVTVSENIATSNT